MCRLSTSVSGPALPPGYKREEPSSSSDESDQEIAAKRAKTSHAAADTPGYIFKINMEVMRVTTEKALTGSPKAGQRNSKQTMTVSLDQLCLQALRNNRAHPKGNQMRCTTYSVTH